MAVPQGVTIFMLALIDIPTKTHRVASASEAGAGMGAGARNPIGPYALAARSAP
jgi:hypothetical protein